MPRAKQTPRPAVKPRGFDHRVNVARHRPESPAMKTCDLCELLGLCAASVHQRDAHLRPAMMGLKSTKERRYSWANYLAYVALVTG